MAPESYYIEPVVSDLRRFVEDLRNLLDRGLSGQPLLNALKPPTERLIDDSSWIADEWRRPDLDIHQVAIAGDEPSVALHVLSNDLGTVERQPFAPEEQMVVDFVSGYTNVDGRSNRGR
jgi:predicted metal-dependent enzyme (double-stranded beta helix superfamily)